MNAILPVTIFFTVLIATSLIPRRRAPKVD